MNTQTHSVTHSVTKNSPAISVIKPEQLYDPTPHGYSHAVLAAPVSKIAFIAGQGGENTQGELSNNFADQVAQAYQNLRSVLTALQVEPQQVVKLNTYVVDYEQAMLAVMTQVLTDTFGDHKPAQTLVPVPRLALDGMLFEVDAIVVMA